MNKQQRHQLLQDLINTQELRNQHQVLASLQGLGVLTNQATISRDFAEMGIHKINGIYKMPNPQADDSQWLSNLDVYKSGDNMLVVKTVEGLATYVAKTIDKTKLPGIVGTIAGDDTVFVAVKNRSAQQRLSQQLARLSSFL